MRISNSLSDGLIINEVTLPGGGVIGIVRCPGRIYANDTRCTMHGKLEADLDALEAWGAQVLISLIEGPEFNSLGVPGFATEMHNRNLRWYQEEAVQV